MTSIRSIHKQVKTYELSRYRRAWLIAVVLFCLLTILVVACQSADQGIVGVWNSGFVFIQFDKDETWELAGMYESIEAGRPLGYGTYQLEDETFSITVDGGVGDCEGITSTYNITFSEQGELSFTPIEPNCSGLNFNLTRTSFSRYSP